MESNILISKELISEINLLIDNGILMIDADGYLAEAVVDNTKPEAYPSFKDFWDMYDKKMNAAKCEKKWNKLSKKAKLKIMEALPAYIKSTPDKQFRKHPMTYLNNRSWEDEVIAKPEKNKLGYTNIKDKDFEFFDKLKYGYRHR